MEITELFAELHTHSVNRARRESDRQHKEETLKRWLAPRPIRATRTGAPFRAGVTHYTDASGVEIERDCARGVHVARGRVGKVAKQNRPDTYVRATRAISYANRAEYDSPQGCIVRAYISGKLNERTFPLMGGATL